MINKEICVTLSPENCFYEKPSRLFRLARFSIKFDMKISKDINEYLRDFDFSDEYISYVQEEFHVSNSINFSKCLSFHNKFPKWMEICLNQNIYKIFRPNDLSSNPISPSYNTISEINSKMVVICHQQNEEIIFITKF